MQDLHQAPRARLGHHGEQRSSVGQYENRVAQSWNVVDDPDELRDRMGVRNVLSGDALPPADFLSLPVPQHSEEEERIWGDAVLRWIPPHAHPELCHWFDRWTLPESGSVYPWG